MASDISCIHAGIHCVTYFTHVSIGRPAHRLALVDIDQLSDKSKSTSRVLLESFSIRLLLFMHDFFCSITLTTGQN